MERSLPRSLDDLAQFFCVVFHFFPSFPFSPLQHLLTSVSCHVPEMFLSISLQAGESASAGLYFTTTVHAALLILQAISSLSPDSHTHTLTHTHTHTLTLRLTPQVTGCIWAYVTLFSRKAPESCRYLVFRYLAEWSVFREIRNRSFSLSPALSLSLSLSHTHTYTHTHTYPLTCSFECPFLSLARPPPYRV